MLIYSVVELEHGKTTTCRIIANMINEGKGQPIELDCASNNGVDHMRQIQEDCRTRPLQGKYKIFILDEVHMITQQRMELYA